MGFWDWLRGRKSVETSTSITTTHVDADLGDGHKTLVRDGVEVTDPAQQKAIIDEIDHLAHEFFAAGGVTAGSAGGAGPSNVTLTSTATVMVDGQVVSADDPRARKKIREAIDTLRAQGLDEIADDLERQLGAASRAAGPVVGEAASQAADQAAVLPATVSGSPQPAARADASSASAAAADEASTDAASGARAEPVEAPDAPDAPAPPPG